jgi:hypothetical protein
MDSLLDQGRGASAARLSRALPGAGLPYLEGALDNPQLTANHVLMMLRNHAVTSDLLGRIALNRKWLKTHGVRAALAAHPKTPRVVAVLLIAVLGWRDLAHISEHPRIDPQVRRVAERRLIALVDDMAQGERICLARIVGREVLAALCADEAPRVIAALLQNPRALEVDALRIAGRPTAPPAVLKMLAENERFGRRPEVRKGVARHPNTPPPIALRLVQTLRTAELKEIARGSKAPRLVKVAAGRRLDEGRQTVRRRRRRGGSVS